MYVWLFTACSAVKGLEDCHSLIGKTIYAWVFREFGKRLLLLGKLVFYLYDCCLICLDPVS